MRSADAHTARCSRRASHHKLVRGKNVVLGTVLSVLPALPEAATRRLIDEVAKLLPAGYEVEAALHARYRPWDQRLCWSPTPTVQGDLGGQGLDRHRHESMMRVTRDPACA